MRRVPFGFLTLSLLVSVGCDKSGADASEHNSRSRVNAVAPTAKDAISAEGFCDVFYEPDKAPQLKLPPLAKDAVLVETTGWRWINLWATWCKPCIEEMPRLLEWRKKLADKGLAFELSFVSADESDETVANFRSAHPGLPESSRLASSEGLAPWLESLGVAGASLPVQLFVDKEGAIRCIRSSAVSAHELDGVADLLRR